MSSSSFSLVKVTEDKVTRELTYEFKSVGKVTTLTFSVEVTQRKLSSEQNFSARLVLDRTTGFGTVEECLADLARLTGRVTESLLQAKSSTTIPLEGQNG